MSKYLKLLVLVTFLAVSACSTSKDMSIEGKNSTGGYSESESGTKQDGIVEESIADAKDNENYEPDPEANIAFMSDVVNIVFFDFDSTSLNEESMKTLQEQAAWLEANKDTRIMVEGHCDERGTREYNLALGAKRAAAVKDYLVALGVDSSRIKTISYGKERPMILDSTKSAWSKNRRAVTILY